MLGRNEIMLKRGLCRGRNEKYKISKKSILRRRTEQLKSVEEIRYEMRGEAFNQVCQFEKKHKMHTYLKILVNRGQ